jgi:hypothetical protein
VGFKNNCKARKWLRKHIFYCDEVSFLGTILIRTEDLTKKAEVIHSIDIFPELLIGYLKILL